MEWPQILKFYALDACTESEAMPYVWSNTVSTVDGLTNFAPIGLPAADVADVALRSLDPLLSAADFKLLNSGWAMADAILISGQITRHELHASCVVSYSPAAFFILLNTKDFRKWLTGEYP